MCAAVRDKKPGFDSEFTGTELKIKLRGEIDHHSAVAVRTAIDDMIKNKKPRKLVIDMSAVELMDSSGLGLIMGRYSLMKEMSGETMVLDPNPRIERIMSLAGLERIVRINYSSPKEQVRMRYPRKVRGTSAVMSVEGEHLSSGPEKRKRENKGEKK